MPNWLQYIAFLFTAIIALNALLSILDRLRGRFAEEEQAKLYREALKELRSERYHVSTLAEANNPGILDTSVLKNRITVEYPYPGIVAEAKRLKRFKRLRVWSRHFWRYWMASRQVIKHSRAVQEAVAHNAFADAKRSAAALVPPLDKLISRLEEDASSA